MATKLNSPRATADRLGLKNVNTLAVWRCVQRYPLEYEAIENFIRSRTVTPGEPTKRSRRRAKQS